MSDRPLTIKQTRFAEEMAYPDAIQREAAIRAGYSPDSASSIASALMKNPSIQNKIKLTREQLGISLGITPERILQELALIGFSKADHYLKDNEDGDKEIDMSMVDGAFAVEVETSVSGKEKVKRTKIKMLDKADALLKLGKYIGMFDEKIEVNHTMSLEDLVASSYKPVESDIIEGEIIENKSENTDNIISDTLPNTDKIDN